ncbi:MAG: HAMP domain-containing protein [Deltaproteobacteria bacterium]|nr:HAMP domain-containing protein [Deltaproteobacteria bacterium]
MKLVATSIRTKLILLVGLGALVPLGGVAAVAVRDVRDIRRDMVARSTLVASTVAEYSAADLAFDDRDAAEKTIGKLGRLEQVEGAALYDIKGRMFTIHRVPDLAEAAFPRTIAPTTGSAVDVKEDHIDVFHPVVFGDVRYGTLYLRTATTPLERRIRSFLWGIGLLALGVVGSSVAVVMALERLVSRRILHLASIARSIAEKEDYSVRAAASDADEIGVLGGSFNRMVEELARRQNDARRAIQVRDEFMSIASHELKTPLTALWLQVQGLERKAADMPENARKAVRAIVRHLQRLDHLIGNLLDVSRIASGRLTIERSEVDLATLVREVAARFDDEARRCGSAIDVDAAGPVVGDWDPFRLEQVVTNLVSNALKYGREKPIAIKVEGDAARGRLVVRDRGIGIAREDVERIFGRYERAVSGRHYAGLGLGLYITNQIVAAHRGVIRVESEPGAGSTFTVELPRRTTDPPVT